MDFTLSFPEMLIIFVIVLLLFGPRLLPAIGRGLVEIMRDSNHEPDDSRLPFTLLILLALTLVVVRLFQIFS